MYLLKRHLLPDPLKIFTSDEIEYYNSLEPEDADRFVYIIHKILEAHSKEREEIKILEETIKGDEEKLKSQLARNGGVVYIFLSNLISTF